MQKVSVSVGSPRSGQIPAHSVEHMPFGKPSAAVKQIGSATSTQSVGSLQAPPIHPTLAGEGGMKTSTPPASRSTIVDASTPPPSPPPPPSPQPQTVTTSAIA